MKILSINNAFQPSITAFSENEKIIFSITAYQKDDWPNNILYITKTMFDSLGIAPKDIELVSVVYGPGSFTGTRVGVIEGKITSYALNIPIVPVNSLKFIAAHFKEEVHPILPAGKNEYFIAKFNNGERVEKDRIEKKEFLKEINGILVSPCEEIKDIISNLIIINPDPEVLISLTLKEYADGNIFKDPLSLNPLYLHAIDTIFKKYKNGRN